MEARLVRSEILLPAATSPAAAAPQDRRATAFVLAVWGAITLADLVLTAHFGLTSPFADEWRWNGIISGVERPTAQWFWLAENEHRMPLAKAIYVGVGWLTDFRLPAGGIFSVLLMSLAALVVLWVVRRLRGFWTPLDVLVPVTLLHFGQCYNFVWGFQLFCFVSMAFGLGILLVVATRRGELSLGAALAAAGCLAGATASGGGGVAYVPATAVWIGYAGCRRLGQRPAREKAAGGALLALAACMFLAVPFYFAGLAPRFAASPWGRQHLWPSLVVGTQALSTSVGRLGHDLWPVSGLLAVLVPALAAALLIRQFVRRPAQRVRTAGLALFLVSMLALALGIGFARHPFGNTMGLADRYTTLFCPLVLGLYLTGVCYGPALSPRVARIAALLPATMAAAYTLSGIHYAAGMQAPLLRMERLVQSGWPLEVIAARCHCDVQALGADGRQLRLLHMLEQLRQGRRGPFRYPPHVDPWVPARCTPLVTLHGTEPGMPPDEICQASRIAQPFVAVADLPLRRVEFRVRANAGTKLGAAAFHWKLWQIEADGQRKLRAESEGALIGGPDPLFVSLDFPAAPLAGGKGAFLLEIASPAGTPLGFPLYRQIAEGRPPNGLAGFLYFSL